MKANSLEELVTNSNIAGELRNYTDWHTRLIKFAQLVANWQKEQMLKDAVEGYVTDVGINYLDLALFEAESLGLKDGDKVRIIVLKAEEG